LVSFPGDGRRREAVDAAVEEDDLALTAGERDVVSIDTAARCSREIEDSVMLCGKWRDSMHTPTVSRGCDTTAVPNLRQKCALSRHN
jgi:hypothetical protein